MPLHVPLVFLFLLSDTKSLILPIEYSPVVLEVSTSFRLTLFRITALHCLGSCNHGNLACILVNDQLDALFLNVFISCLYVFRAASAHYQEGQIVLIHHLV
jgi:hypothetical protein